MKTLFRLFALVPLLVLSACAQKEETYVPGEPETEGCYYVYFPAQSGLGQGELLITPDKEKFVDITVCRRNTEGAVDVPYVLTSNVDPAVFDRGTLSFGPGEGTTTVRIGLADAPAYQSITVSVSVEDPQFAAIYESEAQSVTFSFLLVELVELGHATFTQQWWASNFFGYSPPITVEADIVYYELDGVRYCHTENEESSTGYPGFWGFGGVEEFKGNHLYFNWYPREADGLGREPVELPVQAVGFEDWSDYGLGVCHYVLYDAYHFWQEWWQDRDYGDFLNFARKYTSSNPAGYYDGDGGFHFPVFAYILPEYTAYDARGYAYYTSSSISGEDLVGILK